MTNILELLKNEKVEWKKLGKIKEIEVITAKTKLKKTEYNIEGKYPIIDQGQDFIAGYTNRESALFDLDEYVIFGDHTESVKYVDFRFAQGADGIRVLKTNKSYIKPRYLYHVILNFYEKQGKYMRHFSLLKQTEIPIPSIETQEKIVEILDKFTNYVTELQTELQVRTKQYTYYRDKLLSEEYLNKITKEMEEDRRLRVEKLKNICEFKRGKRLVKNELQEEGDFPVYQNSITPLGYYHEKNFDKDTTFIISAGAAGEIVYSDRDFWAADDVYVLLTREDIISRYLYYCLMSKQYIIKSKVRKASIPRLSKDNIEKIIVPIPPLSLQNKIVKILDKFQILLADTKGLLPEEIEQRQKQYEYYREKLLTFDVECDSTHARTHARTHIISNTYYESLQEAARVVDVDIEDKVIKYQLSGIAGYSSQKISAEKLTVFNYVGVDNLLKDKYGKEDSKYVPQEGNFTKFTKDSILIGNIRPYLRKIWYADTIGGTNGDVLAIYVQEKNIVKSRYLYHVLADERFFEYNIKYSKGAKMPRGDKKKIMEYKFSLPPLHVQQHIVNTLDKFDTLVNDIKEGLPKEIEERQKQYEYWRECLLSFPKQY